MALKAVIGLACACAIFLSGCEARIVGDLSATPEYRAMIGARYEIVGDVVAYGVKLDLQQPPDYIDLIPPPGVSGPEIAFTVPVAHGTQVTVRQIVMTNRWLDSGVTVLVQMAGTPLPVQLPVRIAVFRGNEGAGNVLLNPQIYRKLSP